MPSDTHNTTISTNGRVQLSQYPRDGAIDTEIALKLIDKAAKILSVSQGWLAICEFRLREPRPIDSPAASVIWRAATYVQNDLAEVSCAIGRLRRCLGE
jgi:hypothetical protein